MPLRTLIILLSAVIAAAGLTVWALNLGGPSVLMTTLPAFTLAVLALRIWRK